MFYHFHSYSLKLDFLDLAQVSNQGNWPSTRTLNKEEIILENRKTTSRFSVSAEVMPFDGKGVFAQGSDAVYLCLVFAYGSTSLMPSSTKKLNIDTPLQKTV